MGLKINYFLFIIFIWGCKQNEVKINSNEGILTTPTWMIQKASGKGAGYDYSFILDNGPDPFQFTKVRIKLEPNGNISGVDNNGNALKNANWKYDDSAKRMEISGTGIFGIDGSLEVLTLQTTLVEIKNSLKVPQLNATIDLNATLVPAK